MCTPCLNPVAQVNLAMMSWVGSADTVLREDRGTTRAWGRGVLISSPPIGSSCTRCWTSVPSRKVSSQVYCAVGYQTGQIERREEQQEESKVSSSCLSCLVLPYSSNFIGVYRVTSRSQVAFSVNYYYHYFFGGCVCDIFFLNHFFNLQNLFTEVMFEACILNIVQEKEGKKNTWND